MDNNNEPQPQQPPQPPVQPGAPVGTPYQIPQKPSSNKKLIIWIGAAIGVLAAVGIATAVSIAVFSVSKEDYRKAYNQMNEVSSANYNLSSKLYSIQYGVSSSTDTKFNNDLKAVKEAVEKVREETKKLSELKATKVGEGKKKYDEFNEKLEKYLTFISDAATSIGDMREASVVCSEVRSSPTGSVESAKSMLEECKSALNKIRDTPNQDVKNYVKKITTEFDNLSSLMDKASNITDPYGSQYSEYSVLRNQTYEVQDNIRDAATDFGSDFEKHAKEVEVKDVANDYIDFLDEKARK